MKLLLVLFVVLTVLGTLCTGRTISRTLCEKIVSCRNRFLSTPVVTEESDWHPQNNDNKDCMAHYDTTSTEISYDACQIFRSLKCPGGTHLLRSGRCSSPIIRDFRL